MKMYPQGESDPCKTKRKLCLSGELLVHPTQRRPMQRGDKIPILSTLPLALVSCRGRRELAISRHTNGRNRQFNRYMSSSQIPLPLQKLQCCLFQSVKTSN